MVSVNRAQPLVDAAFLAQGLLRAPKQLWGNLDPQAKEWMITELKRSRNIKPFENNWLLFGFDRRAACWSLQENVIWNGCCME